MYDQQRIKRLRRFCDEHTKRKRYLNTFECIEYPSDSGEGTNQFSLFRVRCFQLISFPNDFEPGIATKNLQIRTFQVSTWKYDAYN